MSLVLRTVASAAAFAISVSAYGQYPNATYHPSAIDVAGWKYDSCTSLCEGDEFTLVATQEYMTVETCLLECSSYEYAAVHGT
jgi:hypothetical protein